MSAFHLDELKKALEKHHWVVVAESEGDDYKISSFWHVERPDGSQGFKLAFDGLHESGVLPVEKSYACHIERNPEISLYFSKPGTKWKESLNSFMEQVAGNDV